MENASDALVMAGTVLISIVIISALVFMFNGIVNYQKTATTAEEEEQKTNFNKEYTSFEKDLYGSEILSLINKAVDYNEQYQAEGYVPIKIVITVKNGTGNNNRNSFVSAGTYEISTKDSNIVSSRLLDEINKIKNKYNGDKYLQRLVALNDSNDIKELDRVLGEINGAYDHVNSTSDIEKYSEYMEFKRKKFEFTKTVYHGERPGDDISSTNGRIVEMHYTEIIN